MSYRIGEHQSDVVLLYAFSNPPGYLTRLASEVCDEIMLPDVLSARFEFSLLQINSSSLASLSLVHPVQDYAYIPSEALADRSAKLSPEYRLLIFFGDRKFSWKRAGQLFSFAEYYNEAMKQPIFGMKDEFERALQHARSWSNARTLGQPLDPITSRNVTTLLKVPNICGTCAVCIKDTAQKRSGPQVVHNTRFKNGSDVSHLVNDLKKGCPQLDVIELARAGHVGATLAMRKHAAEGQRLMVHWPSDGKFYAGEITSFDALTYTFRIDYDDGDVEQESKLWQETVVLVVSSMDGNQACTKVQNAHEAFKLQSWKV